LQGACLLQNKEQSEERIAFLLCEADYIINKAPGPDILPGIIDEDIIGISYRKLDIILYGLEKKYSISKIARISGLTYNEIKRVIEIIDKSEYLRKWPVMF